MHVLPLLLTGCLKTVPPTTTVEPPQTDHGFPFHLYDAVFEGTVDVAGFIDYAAIRDDRDALSTYLAYVAAVSPDSHPELFDGREAELAYWIGAYNGLAVRGVIDRPELTSVIDIKVEYFYGTRYRMGGSKVSLYKLENGIIRDRYADPRIHFYLNCQSLSCPAFPKIGATPDNVDALLDEATTAFVNDPAHVSVRDDGTIEVSSIFDWYASDFDAAGGVLPFIHAYRDDIPEAGEVTFKTYDWTLIAQDGRGPGDP